MTRLTQAQALEFFDSIFVWEPDMVNDARVESFIVGASWHDVRADFEDFCASYGLDVEDESVEIVPDTAEEYERVSATRVTIKLAPPQDDTKEMVA